jgi:hypothetical protein
MADTEVLALAKHLMSFGIGEFDALHAASAFYGKADILVTTDDKFMKRMRAFGELKMCFPFEALALIEQWYDV